MSTSFETASVSFVQAKCIEIHLRKGRHHEEEVNASIFFRQRLMHGDSVEDAKEQTEIAYQGICINLDEQEPVTAGFGSKYKNWKVTFDYQDEST